MRCTLNQDKTFLYNIIFIYNLSNYLSLKKHMKAMKLLKNFEDHIMLYIRSHGAFGKFSLCLNGCFTSGK